MLRFSVLPIVLLFTGCVSVAGLANSPSFINELKIRSAGFTGCATDQNEITNVAPNLNGSGTWNATCKGKVYLCSEGSSAGEHSGSYSCAVAVN